MYLDTETLPVREADSERERQLHEFAAAIRRGCALAPKQIREEFFGGDGEACALGAAWLGTGRSALELGPHLDPFCRIFPAISVEVFARAYLHNDYHGWTREHIAQWLDAGADPSA